VNDALRALNSFLYNNRAFEALLAVPSLEIHVKVAMITAEQHRRDARPGEYFNDTNLFDGSRPNYPEKLADVLEYEESLDPDDPSSTPVLRCCKSMVAWVRGSASLSRSKLFQMETLPECYIVHAYLCSDLGSITKLPDLMEKTILPKLKSTAGIDNNAFIRQLIGRKDFKGKSKFSGTIHCEASLMALVHMFSSVGPSEKRVHPFSEKTTRELKAIFSVSICATEHTCHWFRSPGC
jgi:hypothetical protein